MTNQLEALEVWHDHDKELSRSEGEVNVEEDEKEMIFQRFPLKVVPHDRVLLTLGFKPRHSFVRQYQSFSHNDSFPPLQS